MGLIMNEEVTQLVDQDKTLYSKNNLRIWAYACNMCVVDCDLSRNHMLYHLLSVLMTVTIFLKVYKAIIDSLVNHKIRNCIVLIKYHTKQPNLHYLTFDKT